MFKKILMISSLAVSLTLSGHGQERGKPVFQDTFDTYMTFAENWRTRSLKENTVSKDGHVLFSSSGVLNMTCETPVDFYAEMDITLSRDNTESELKKQSAVFGFDIGNFRFLVKGDGTSFVIGPPGTVNRVKIEGFALDSPMHLTLARKVSNGTARYRFLVNGKDAGGFITKEPLASATANGSKVYKPLSIICQIPGTTMDNFSLSTLKTDASDSPNEVINSGFEFEQDGFPPYYRRGENFIWSKINEVPYEDYLNTWSLDDKEKHSGKYSLKLINDEITNAQGFDAWGSATVKNIPGVFSVWMKADQDSFPVKIIYCGKVKNVKVGKKWARYEVVNPKLPASSSMTSPISIGFKEKGTLWVDDLQSEFLDEVPSGDEIDSGKLFASPYKPSTLDQQKFAKKEKEVIARGKEIVVPKLGEHFTPGKLDEWKGMAYKTDDFLYLLKSPADKTELYLGCDNDNLYVGYRCYMSTSLPDPTVPPKDGGYSAVCGRESVELKLDPEANGAYFNLTGDFSGATRSMGKNADTQWKCDWKSVATLNEKERSVDYVITLPLHNFASPGMKRKWLVNFARNDRAKNIFPCIAPGKKPAFMTFVDRGYWPFMKFPAEVIKSYSLGVSGATFSGSDDTFSFSLPFVNNTGRARSVKVEVFDMEQDDAIIGSRETTLQEGETVLVFNDKRKTKKLRVKLTEDGKSLSNQILTLEKRDPVSILGRLNYYMNEPDAVFKVNTSLANPDRLTAVLECGGQKTEAKAAKSFRISLSLKNITDGKHEVTLKMMRDGKVAGIGKTMLIKRPFKKGAVQINRFSRSLLHNGKPIIPVTPFLSVVYRDEPRKQNMMHMLDYLVKYGFKYGKPLVVTGDPGLAEWTADYVKTAQKKGISIRFWANYSNVKRFPDGKKELSPMSDEEIAACVKMIDSPNIITHLLSDEPEICGESSNAVRDYMRHMRKFFPYHPILINYTVLGIPARFADLETDLMQLDDYLTNREGRTVQSVVQNADIMWQMGAEEGKPCFFIIACATGYREPFYAEQIAQSYGCVAAGCTGLDYFYGFPKTMGNFKACVQVNKELQSLTDVLGSDEECSESQSTGDPKLLRHRTKKHDGYLYLITCNIDENPAGKVTFTLPTEFRYDDQAEVLFENRKIPVKDGRFSDEFPDHFRHVYKIKLK